MTTTNGNGTGPIVAGPFRVSDDSGNGATAMTDNDCYRCGRSSALNPMRMCAPCQTMWFGMTADQRRALIYVVAS